MEWVQAKIWGGLSSRGDAGGGGLDGVDLSLAVYCGESQRMGNFRGDCELWYGCGEEVTLGMMRDVLADVHQ